MRPTESPVSAGTDLAEVMGAVVEAPLVQTDPDDDFSSPMELGAPFRLRLDWWKDQRGGSDRRAGGDRFKVWAGSMRSVRIARAMRSGLGMAARSGEGLFDQGFVVFDPIEPEKKVEPYYFDARRGASAQPIDIGFSPDALQLSTAAYPAVEFLCLVGLQRCRPRPVDAAALSYEYDTWLVPLDLALTPAAVSGVLPHARGRTYRFEVAYRTDQKKHKAFTPATMR